MDTYGVGHRKEVEKPKTKKELATILRLEARSHANTCEETARSARLFNVAPSVCDALDKAAKFLRELAK